MKTSDIEIGPLYRVTVNGYGGCIGRVLETSIPRMVGYGHKKTERRDGVRIEIVHAARSQLKIGSDHLVQSGDIDRQATEVDVESAKLLDEETALKRKQTRAAADCAAASAELIRYVTEKFGDADFRPGNDTYAIETGILFGVQARIRAIARTDAALRALTPAGATSDKQ